MNCARILICEDDDELLEIFDLILSIEGFEIVIAKNGVELKSKIDKGDFDLILLDLGLPDIDGEHLCKYVCENYDIPVIVVSAKSNVGTKVLCLEYGADDYIVKPFETVELVARIKSVLRRHKKQIEKNINKTFSKKIEWGEYSIDLEKRVVVKGDVEIDLTPKEFQLMVFFAENKGKTFKREEIIEAIWGHNSLYRWSRAVDVHINHLRKKIEENPANPKYIQTIPGIGYKAAE